MELKVPLYYVLKRLCSDEETQAVLDALSITPLLGVVITDPHDADFALKISNEVFRTQTIEGAHELARKVSTAVGEPLLIMGEALFLDAYFEDGTHEEVMKHV